MILVDTSVWIDHLRRGSSQLESLLNEGDVLCHEFVIGELACGNLRNRDELLNLLASLPAAPEAQHVEVLHLIGDRDLAGHGLGWVDMHLLASALLSNCGLWTMDKALTRAAIQLKLA